MTAAITAEALSFTYPARGLFPRRPAVQALDDVSFRLRTGCVSGVVGHNGAGKTTLLLLAAGLKKPKRGSIEVLGKRATDASIIPRVGILTDRLSFFREMRVKEVVRIFALMHRILETEALEPFEQLDLMGHQEKYIKELSSGLRKRVSIAVAVMHRPEMILLDEPFAGLDPPSVRTISGAIEEWTKEGRTVVVSSHDLPELEQLIEDVVVLQEKKVLASGRFLDLVRQHDLVPHVRIETSAGSRDVEPDRLEEELARVRKAGESILRISTRGTTLADLYQHLHSGN